jgi:leucyl-tRNA synthetase
VTDDIERLAFNTAVAALMELVNAATGNGGLITHEQIELPVQIGGKVRARVTVDTDAPSAEIEKLVLADEKVQARASGSSSSSPAASSTSSRTEPRPRVTPARSAAETRP